MTDKLERTEDEALATTIAGDRWRRLGSTGQTQWVLLVGLALGVVSLLVALHHVWSQPLDHDARGYVWLTSALVEGRAGSGVPEQYLDQLFGIRLTGYPILLSPFVALGLEGLALRLAVTGFQLAAYWLSVGLVFSGLSRLSSVPTARRVAFALLAMPFPYLLIVEVVTEAITISVALASVGAVMLSASSVTARSRLAWAAMACAGSGLAMLIRTDSLFVPAMCAVGLSVAGIRFLPATLRFRRVVAVAAGFVAVAVSVALFRVPQFILTRKHTGVGEWDTPIDVATPEFEFGVSVIKWTTGIGEISGGYRYRNPLLTAAMEARFGASPLDWYEHEPLRGIGLIGLKWFALIDQDVPFVYNEVVSGSPNRLVFIINHTMAFIGVLGFLLVVRMCARRCIAPDSRVIAAAFTTGAGVWLAIHALPHVETRYGLPALVALTACAGWWASRDRILSNWRLVVGGLIVYLPIAWILSIWLIGFRSAPV